VAFAGSLFLLVAAFVFIRQSFLGGLRAAFAAGIGGVYASVGLAFLGWEGEMTPTMFAASAFVVVGWILVMGGFFQVKLNHARAYDRYIRETSIWQRLVGYSPRLYPRFEIRREWLFGGMANAALAAAMAVVIPGQFLLIWGLTAMAAAMMLAGTGAFSGPDGSRWPPRGT
jgi:hypothetical protein